jgi:hypothetical protein
MFTSKKGLILLLAATIAVGAPAARADFWSDTQKNVQGTLPQVTVRKNLDVEVTQPGIAKATVSPNPLSGPPHVEGQTGNKDIDNLVKNIDGVNHLPQQAAGAVGDAAAKAVEAEVNKFIEGLKKKFWDKYEELKAKYLPYVYLAAAALVLILMLPGFVGALFAIWLVRVLDRRSARKRKLELKAALDVVKTQANEIDTKLAA